MLPQTLDLRGLRCPLPALKAKKALSALTSGELLRVECTDPLSAIDIPNLLRETGDEMVESGQANGIWTFVIRRKTKNGT